MCGKLALSAPDHRNLQTAIDYVFWFFSKLCANYYFISLCSVFRGVCICFTLHRNPFVIRASQSDCMRVHCPCLCFHSILWVLWTNFTRITNTDFILWLNTVYERPPWKKNHLAFKPLLFVGFFWQKNVLCHCNRI